MLGSEKYEVLGLQCNWSPELTEKEETIEKCHTAINAQNGIKNKNPSLTCTDSSVSEWASQTKHGSRL